MFKRPTSRDVFASGVNAPLTVASVLRSLDGNASFSVIS